MTDGFKNAPQGARAAQRVAERTRNDCENWLTDHVEARRASFQKQLIRA